MASVLWASSKLGFKDPELWSSTLEAFMEQLQKPDAVVCFDVSNAMYSMATIASANRGVVPGVSKDGVTAAVIQLGTQMQILTSAPQLDGVNSQQVCNALWACAKLRINPGDAVLNSMLQAMARPALRENSDPQAVANALWAVSELQRRCSWQPAVREQVWQLLLSEQQLLKAADNGRPQEVSNAVFALAQLATAEPPALSQEFVQRCVQQLLQGKAAAQLASWNSQDVCNVAWACAKLGLPQPDFMADAAANASRWLPAASGASINQAAFACATLQFKDEQLLAGMLQWCKRQLAHGDGNHAGGMRVETASVATLSWVCWAVAALDLQTLALEVKALVAGSWGKADQGLQMHPSDASRLWEVHSWLVQQQLLDGQGLAGLLNEERLAMCKAESEARTARNAQSLAGST